MTDILPENATGANITSYTSNTTTVSDNDILTTSVYEPSSSDDQPSSKEPWNLSMMIDVMESKLKQTDENDVNYSTMQQTLQNALNMQAEMQAHSKNPLTEPLPVSSSEEEQQKTTTTTIHIVLNGKDVIHVSKDFDAVVTFINQEIAQYMDQSNYVCRCEVSDDSREFKVFGTYRMWVFLRETLLQSYNIISINI